MKNYLINLLGFGLLLGACKKEQPRMSSLEEDCSCVHEVSAGFKMEEIYAYGNNWERRTVTADTSYSNKNIAFYAAEDNADYTWYIGNEILKAREVVRFFSENLNGQSIPITLVVKKKANTICLPNDDGYDSTTKILTLVEFNTDVKFRLEGQFKVKSPLLKDSTVITIEKSITPSYTFFNVYNFDGKGTNCINSFDKGEMKMNFRDYYVPVGANSISNGGGLNGSFILYADNSVFFDINTGNYINGIFDYKLYLWNYKGRKL